MFGLVSSKRHKELKNRYTVLENKYSALSRGYSFELKSGKPTLVIKMGNKESGWIPSERSFVRVTKFVKESGLDKEFNVLLFHYGIEFELLNKDLYKELINK